MDHIRPAAGSGIPADGSVTWFSRFFGPLPGETVAGFSVAFTFTGDGVPGSQEFVFIDPRLSEVVGRGFTEPLPPAIPEPSQVALLCIGLMGFAAKRIQEFLATPLLLRRDRASRPYQTPSQQGSAQRTLILEKAA